MRFEDRQYLLGHKSACMTTHYSAPELARLVAAAYSVYDRDGVRPEMVIMRVTRRIAPTKSPQGKIRGQLKSV